MNFFKNARIPLSPLLHKNKGGRADQTRVHPQLCRHYFNRARRDWERGTNIGELARRLFTDPGIVENRLKRVTTERLEEQQRDLLAADVAVKTGLSTLESAVEKFIVKHSVYKDAAR